MKQLAAKHGTELHQYLLQTLHAEQRMREITERIVREARRCGSIATIIDDEIIVQERT